MDWDNSRDRMKAQINAVFWKDLGINEEDAKVEVDWILDKIIKPEFEKLAGKPSLEEVTTKVKQLTENGNVVFADDCRLARCSIVSPDICNYFVGVILENPCAWLSDESYISEFADVYLPGDSDYAAHKEKILHRTLKDLDVRIDAVYDKPFFEVIEYLIEKGATVPYQYKGLNAFKMFDLSRKGTK